MRGLAQAALGAAFADDPDFRKITARAALLDPEIQLAGHAPAVREVAPLNVSDVPFSAGADETHRHHRFWFIAIERFTVAALFEILDLHEPPAAVPVRRLLRILDDEPVWKDVAFHPGLHLALSELQILSGWRAAQFNGRPLEKPANFRRETRLMDDTRLIRPVAPALQAGDDHRFVRQIHHRAGAEGADELVGTELGALAHELVPMAEGSCWMSTAASTSRMERFAQKRRSSSLALVSVGSRKSRSNAESLTRSSNR